jgi:hypothetical protein
MTMILSIDPGNVTGLALYFPTAGSLVTKELRKDETYQYIDDVVGSSWYMVEIVAERFVISQRTIKSERQGDALDILGYLDSVRCLRGVPLTLQTAAQAKSFATDDKLRRLGWYQKTKDGHANDACRHLLVYLVSKRDPDILRKLADAQP